MIITRDFVKAIYKKRPRDAHKGQYGKLLIVGGSKLYSGSPALAGLAALRTGTDLVTITAPERAANIIATFSPDLITWPLRGDWLCQRHVKEIKELAKNAKAMLIGNGLGHEKETLKAVKKLQGILPCVLDADALRAIENAKIITPHAREFERIAGFTPPKNLKERSEAVKSMAKDLGCVVLLKGEIDIISDGKKIMLNKTGSSYMTKGGTGDTLAGIAAGLLSRGIDAFKAAAAAAWINGKAGELAGKEGMLASDILKYLPKFL